MKVSKFLGALKQLPVDYPLAIYLPNNDLIPLNFHITEVGEISYRFIDCGGELHSESICLLQVWVADDVEHRLSPAKLIKIIELATKTLDIMDSEIEMEYGSPSVQYNLKEINVTLDFNPAEFILEGKETDCLAPDKCGVNKCCGEGGCCD